MSQAKKSPHCNVGLELHEQSGISPLALILDRLESPRKTSDGFLARCPSHDDRTPSLSVSEASDGRVLIHCFAGCSAKEILGAIHLELADLFPGHSSSGGHVYGPWNVNRLPMSSKIRAAVNVLALESDVLIIGGRKAIAGTISYEDLERMALSVTRIMDTRRVLNAQR